MTCRFYDTRGGGASLALLEIPKSIYILPYPWMYLSEPRLTCRVPGFTGVSASLLMLGTRDEEGVGYGLYNILYNKEMLFFERREKKKRITRDEEEEGPP